MCIALRSNHPTTPLLPDCFGPACLQAVPVTHPCGTPQMIVRPMLAGPWVPSQHSQRHDVGSQIRCKRSELGCMAASRPAGVPSECGAVHQAHAAGLAAAGTAAAAGGASKRNESGCVESARWWWLGCRMVQEPLLHQLQHSHCGHPPPPPHAVPTVPTVQRYTPGRCNPAALPSVSHCRRSGAPSVAAAITSGSLRPPQQQDRLYRLCPARSSAPAALRRQTLSHGMIISQLNAL